MSSSNNQISLAELDPDRLKQSFVEYLRTQPLFRDYEYTGSNINQLMDLFSRNTNINGFFLNMVANESFLDSAQIRDSIVSKAKELNYTPRSTRSASSILEIKITTTDQAPSVITIPEGTAFNSRMDDKVFTFTTDESLSAVFSDYVPATNSFIYTFSNAAIYEGRMVEESFKVNNTSDVQRFVLSNQNIDTQSLQVTVVESDTNSANAVYTKKSSLLNVGSRDEIFFVEATSNELYEIVFGDGILGKKPTTGNIIKVSYRVSSGEDANGCRDFKLVSNAIAGYTSYTIEVVDKARGGSTQETNDSIKFNAPRHYQTQERAVSEPDYSSLLREEFPEIRALNIYGGDEVNPPKYGKVIISVDLQDYDGVPVSKKNAIASFIQPKMSPTIKAEVVDPDFMYIEVVLNATYSLSLTNTSSEDVRTSLISAIQAFDDKELGNFNVKFRYSHLGTAIDEAEEALTGTNLAVRMYAVLYPEVNVLYRKTLFYQNALIPGSLISSTFVYNDISAFLTDDGKGRINISTYNGPNVVALTAPVGTIDYASGIATISGLTVSEYTGDAIRLYVETVSQDIVASQNTILSIGVDNSTVDVTPVRT